MVKPITASQSDSFLSIEPMHHLNPEKSTIFQAKYPQHLDPNYQQKIKISDKLLTPINHLMQVPKIVFSITIIGLIRMVTGSGIEKILLPAIEIFKNCKPYYNQRKEAYINTPRNQCSSISFKTADGCSIDGMVKWHDQADYKQHQGNPGGHEPFQKRKWIICFNPNAMCYEQLMSWADEYSQKSQCNVLLFNYRGVMNSTGYPKKANDLVLDGDAAFQFLLDKDVESSSIILHAISLGGGVATQVRALHPDGPIAVERSFSSISALIQGLVYRVLMRNDKKATPRAQKMLAHTVSWIIGSLASCVLNQAQWELNSLKKWHEIKGYKWIITCNKDQLICGIGRLSNALKKQVENFQAINPGYTISELTEALNIIKSEGSDHCDELTPEAEDAHYFHLRKAIEIA